ncbi:MAG: metal ABC transporter substrate-binding protein [Firmicutes bacterium]|nr:metal ABC transporter substrate-binding protein [Bacillota bacterium]
MKKILLFLVLCIFTLGLVACINHSTAPKIKQAGDKISVVATIFPLYDFARAVAGDKVELSILLKAGAEIHSFEPTPADIIKIQNADLLLYIGGANEVWMQRILDSLGNKTPSNLKLIDTVQVLEEEVVEGMESHEENDQDSLEEIELDEHIWTAPANAVLMVNAIALALAEIDKENAAFYRANAAAYCEQLEDLDKQFQEVVDSARRKILVFGDRFPFRYFAAAYGLEYRAAFPGCSTDTEPAARTIAYLIDIVKEYEIPYIYYIELSNENVARSVCEQTGAKRLLFHSCQQISRDDFNAAATYVSLMRQNVENLRKGLN